MWPHKRNQKKVTECPIRDGHISYSEGQEIITRRERSNIDQYKIEILKDLLLVIASEDLNALLLTVLRTLRDLGYNLKDTPENLVAQVQYEAAK